MCGPTARELAWYVAEPAPPMGVTVVTPPSTLKEMVPVAAAEPEFGTTAAVMATEVPWLAAPGTPRLRAVSISAGETETEVTGEADRPLVASPLKTA